MMSRLSLAALGAVLGLSLVVPAPSSADWLVTRAGGRVETKGSWKVKGKLVVFTGANGALASLRLADVDLEASKAATQEAKEAREAAAAQPEPKEPPHKKSVFSLTDADFSRKPPEEATAAADDSAAQGDSAKPKEAKAGRESPVVVSSWSKADRAEGDGVDLFGTLQNTSDNLVTEIGLKVKLRNELGEVVGTGEGVLATTSMTPGGTTSFRVPLPGVFTFEKAEFALTSRSIIATPDPAKATPKDNSPSASDHRR
jgi:hypothetical protein